MRIQMQHIYKSYGKNEVIRDLNMTIEDHKFTTLLGPSGCGKTTLLRMIAGLETPNGGEIWFDDTCVFSDVKKINLPPEQRNMGFVFQDFALWPHLTVFENVAFGLRARKETHDLTQRVMDALQAVKLAYFAERMPSQLSGGQQQRVGFARAMVTTPACILFDEPLSALDAILRDEMRIEIKTITNQLNITAVFVTHDQMEAMSMSDQIVVLNGGRIEQQDCPEEIYQHPRSKFAAKFIGKSNWFGENRMFRPEDAELVRISNADEYSATVTEVQFLGEKYRLYLRPNEETQWIMESPDNHKIGSQVSVFIKKDKIIHF